MEQKAAVAEFIAEIAQAAFAAGVPVGDAPDSELAQWIRTNVRYKDGQEFFIVFLTACELAHLYARSEGYTDAYARAWARVEQRRREDGRCVICGESETEVDYSGLMCCKKCGNYVEENNDTTDA